MSEIFFIAIAKYMSALLGGIVGGVSARRKAWQVGVFAIVAGIALGYILGRFAVEPLLLRHLQEVSRPSVRLF